MSKQTILNYESSAASLNSEPGKRGPYKRGPKSTETTPVVGVYEDPQGPIIVPRNNIPNRYDREALADFYKDQSLDEARAHFDELVFSEGFSEKECFSNTLYSVVPNIYF